MAEQKRKEPTFYRVLHRTDKFNPGEHIELERSVEFDRWNVDRSDLAELVKLPLQELQAKRKDGATAEKTIFGKVQVAAEEWVEQAAQTMLLDRAIEYVKTPEVKHTSNEWKRQKDGVWEISNRVYIMRYKIMQETTGNHQGQWLVTWGIAINRPPRPSTEKYYYSGDVMVVEIKKKYYNAEADAQNYTRTSPKGREVHLFSGFLKCADCGRAITRSVGNNNNVYYACSTYKNRSRTACTMHSIKHNRLEAAVLFAVQQQIHLAVSYSEMIARINTAPVKKSQSIRLEELIAAKERELAKISRYKQSLYQDWKDGEITQQDYRDMKADYERQTIALTDVLARLNAERAELANGVKSEHPALVAFTKHQNIDQLSRELLVELIDHIKVYENGNISVRFKFADEFRRIAEYIEINTTKPAVAG